MRCLILTALVAGTAFADDLPNRYADCIYNGNNECVVRFNLKEHNAFYSIEQYDTSLKRWQLYSSEINNQESNVDPGRFYRVSACKNNDGSGKCHHTDLFWAPVIIPAEHLPAEVLLHELDGSTAYATVNRYLPDDLRLQQYNVYLMSNEFIEAAYDLKTTMSEPPRHLDNDSSFPHTENIIHQMVYQQFDLMQKDLQGNE